MVQSSIIGNILSLLEVKENTLYWNSEIVYMDVFAESVEIGPCEKSRLGLAYLSTTKIDRINRTW